MPLSWRDAAMSGNKWSGYLHSRFAGYHWIDTFFSRVLVFEA